jgi:hypothetical protein
VGLRVEENLGMAHIVGMGPDKVCPRQIIEVALLEQHAGAFIVDVEKRLQVGEVVRCSHLFD